MNKLNKKDMVVLLGICVFAFMLVGSAGRNGRRKAKEIICRANLKQWGNVFSMYLKNNNGMFPEATTTSIAGGRNNGSWMISMRPYYKDNLEITICPSAAKYDNYYEPIDLNHKIRLNPNIDDYGIEDPFYHSYGFNDFCYNPESYHRRKINYWGSCNYQNAENVPIFGDCRRQSSKAFYTDEPPLYPGQPSTSVSENQMRNWCIVRHGGYINLLFMDMSVRKMALKQLWNLKWSKYFSPRSPDEISWPAWMQDLPEE